MSFYSCEKLSFTYGNKSILNGVSLQIKEGNIVSLLGANGAGKSTQMRLFLGLLKPSGGEIRLKNRPLTSYTNKQRALHVSYVPQSTHIAFSFQAIDIVLMGRIVYESWFKQPSSEDIKIALNSMERLNIGHLAKRAFQTLSGGEKQLVLIARSLAQGAKILVMDEPISGLDYGNQLRLLQNILNLSKEGYTFLKSTHLPEHALVLNGHTCALKDGKIIANGQTQKVLNEALIEELYGIKVSFDKTQDGHTVCVPSFIKSSF